jgi:polyisoprenoid-binding protein YceI
MTGRRLKMRRWIIGGVAILLVVGFGGPLVYNQVVAAPALLTLPTGQRVADTSPGAMSLGGLWHVVGPSTRAGFRVVTGALGYQNTVIGRTSKAQGSLMISGNVVRTASFTVDLSSINTSASGRTLMDVATYPTATFVLTHPIQLARTPADGTVQHYAATGALTFHGVTRPVSITLENEGLGSTLYVLTDIPIVFADWHIAVPYGVAGSGTLEVLLGLIQGAGNLP